VESAVGGSNPTQELHTRHGTTFTIVDSIL
jgi:hypothetical protein